MGRYTSVGVLVVDDILFMKFVQISIWIRCVMDGGRKGRGKWVRRGNLNLNFSGREFI